MRLFEPWPAPYTINQRSPYGWRKKHPITGKRTFHHGIDVAMPTGTPLIAGADGVIAHKGAGASGGHTLLIRHDGNWHTVYYHLQKPSHRHVGESVHAGDVVANSGNTGASTGPHLHYELRRSRKWGDTVDPALYFQGKYRTIASERAQEPVTEPRMKLTPKRVRQPSYGISGRFKAIDVLAVNRFMRWGRWGR